MIYLTELDIIEINKQVLRNSNEKYLGVQYPNGLGLVVKQPQMIVFGHELYPNVWLKDAYILQKITKKYIFSDGNKRTAYIATRLFLIKNGYEMRLSKNEVVTLML